MSSYTLVPSYGISTWSWVNVQRSGSPRRSKEPGESEIQHWIFVRKKLDMVVFVLVFSSNYNSCFSLFLATRFSRSGLKCVAPEFSLPMLNSIPNAITSFCKQVQSSTRRNLCLISALKLWNDYFKGLKIDHALKVLLFVLSLVFFLLSC
jgi:hypothetical protein